MDLAVKVVVGVSTRAMAQREMSSLVMVGWDGVRRCSRISASIRVLNM